MALAILGNMCHPRLVRATGIEMSRVLAADGERSTHRGSHAGAGLLPTRSAALPCTPRFPRSLLRKDRETDSGHCEVLRGHRRR